MSLYSDTPDYPALELRRAQIGTCFPRPPGGSCYRELLPAKSNISARRLRFGE